MHNDVHQGPQSFPTSLNMGADEQLLLPILGTFTYIHVLLRNRLGVIPEIIPMNSIRRILTLNSKGVWERDLVRLYPHVDEVHVTQMTKTVVPCTQPLLRSTSFTKVVFSKDSTSLTEHMSDMFDLVSLQFLSPFVPRIDWLELLTACYRVLRPGGFLMWREAGQLQTINPACDEWYMLLNRAIEKAGHSNDMTNIMEVLVEETGLKEIQRVLFPLDLSSGTSAHTALAVHISTFLNAVYPFLLSTHIATDGYLRQLAQEVKKEYSLQTFSALWHVQTVIAQKREFRYCSFNL